MAGTVVWMKQGDTLPSVAATLNYLDGSPIDLSPLGTTVKFVMKTTDGTQLVKVNSFATVTNGPAGQVRYDWAPGDTSLVGTFNAEFLCMVGGKELTVPSDGYLSVVIQPDLV